MARTGVLRPIRPDDIKAHMPIITGGTREADIVPQACASVESAVRPSVNII